MTPGDAGWTTLDAVEAALRAAMALTTRRPFVMGLCGAQGSGKSTLAVGLAVRLERSGVKTAILSIDDLYKTKAAREALARDVHPLLATRGVPGTHDIPIGLATLAALDRREVAVLPRFDKSRDDREPEDRWETAAGDIGVVILEGWCVGAVPEAPAALADPVNALERDEDPDGKWRRYVNDALVGDYQALFGRIDFLVLLAAPGFEVVRAWRTEQEHALRARAGAASGVMSDAGVGRFIQHYERLTRHILREMPARADLVVALSEARVPRGIVARRP